MVEKKKAALITLNPTLDIFFRDTDFSFNQKIFAKQSCIAAGGSAVNVARGLQRLGRSFKLYTILGGEIGTLISRQLVKEKITFSFSENEAETRVTSIFIKGSIRKMLVAPSPKIKIDTIKKFIQDYYSEIANNDIVLIGGSIPEESSEIVATDLIHPLIKQGVKVFMDSRSTFAERVYTIPPYVIKYNNQGNSEINRDLRIACDLHKKGASLVIHYTNRHCYAIYEDHIWHYPNFTLFAKRTYGRGDAFIAGLISAILDENGFDEAIRNAIACGASFTRVFPIGDISTELIPNYLREIQFDVKRRTIESEWCH